MKCVVPISTIATHTWINWTYRKCQKHCRHQRRHQPSALRFWYVPMCPAPRSHTTHHRNQTKFSTHALTYRTIFIQELSCWCYAEITNKHLWANAEEHIWTAVCALCTLYAVHTSAIYNSFEMHHIDDMAWWVHSIVYFRMCVVHTVWR